MDKLLNKEILRLSVPSILANLSVPLVGFVDTAIAGHLNDAAALIGAISVGSMLFNLLYWGFGFLRTGTGGLTAQGFGRKAPKDCSDILWRALAISLAIAAVLVAIRKPFMNLALLVVNASPEVEALASEYFLIRIWAAPATLGLMAFSGWFVGMQDSVSSMWKDFVVNGVNIVASLVLSLGIGHWQGLGFSGIAVGTVVAQYSGLLFCIAVCAVKYRHVIALPAFHGSFSGDFFKLNANLFGRSVFFIAIYIGYTMIAANFGDVLLAVSSIMMQVLMIFSYFTDGFAYAAEALSGRFIGERNPAQLRLSVRYGFTWSMALALVFILTYALLGNGIVHLLTDDANVRECCREYILWLCLMPPLGCAAFFFDGVFLGATASAGMRDSMFWSVVAFFGLWFGVNAIDTLGHSAQMHLLLGAYMAHLAARTLTLVLRYRKDVLSRV